MKRRLKELALLVSVLAAAGLLVVASGVMPIKASSGHWPITRWFLDFASDRSIAFHSQGIKTPPLDEPGMVTLGAATYESNCRWCHGSPVQRRPPVASGMTPTPPYLVDSAQSHAPNELFYLIKHGIKFAGMPAWPTQHRDEEIWPVVAFLKEFPKLDADEYRQLVNPTANTEMVNSSDTISDTNPVARLVADHCAVCHGMDGDDAVTSHVPVLAGQSQTYLHLALEAYRNGNRFSGIMQPVAASLSEKEIAELSAYFASQSYPAASNNSVASELWKLGKQLAHQGDRAQKIPSCVDCHGPDSDKASDRYPQLSGQPARYLSRQLILFSERNRGGSRNASLMHPIADKLDEQQREALATYYQSLEAQN